MVISHGPNLSSHSCCQLYNQYHVICLNCVGLCIVFSIFAPHEELVSKVLLLNSLVGLGVYLYSRHHMQLASPSWQIIYSVGGAVMFNLGNVMFCVVTRVLLPRFDALRTVFGVASGAVFLAIVGRYLQFVDDNLSSMT